MNNVILSNNQLIFLFLVKGFWIYKFFSNMVKLTLWIALHQKAKHVPKNQKRVGNFQNDAI